MPLKDRPLWSKKQIRGSRWNATNDPVTDLRGSLPPGRSAASVYGSDHSVVLADIG
jgi:hypothetical protein